MFKDTEKRSARVLVEEIGSMDSHLIVCTSKEHTTYCAKVMDENVPKTLDFVLFFWFYIYICNCGCNHDEHGSCLITGGFESSLDL